MSAVREEISTGSGDIGGAREKFEEEGGVELFCTLGSRCRVEGSRSSRSHDARQTRSDFGNEIGRFEGAPIRRITQSRNRCPLKYYSSVSLFDVFTLRHSLYQSKK